MTPLRAAVKWRGGSTAAALWFSKHSNSKDHCQPSSTTEMGLGTTTCRIWPFLQPGLLLSHSWCDAYPGMATAPCVQPHCKIASLDPGEAWLWLSGISPLPIPCIISTGVSLRINSFYFFISKEYQLTFTAIHSLSSAPQASYYTREVICTAWIWPVLQLKGKAIHCLSLGERLERSALKFSCVYVFKVRSYYTWQTTKHCYLLKTRVLS